MLIESNSNQNCTNTFIFYFGHNILLVSCSDSFSGGYG